jgi:hypothetical protein
MGYFYPLEAFVFCFNKANPEKQRQKVKVLAYTKTIFACGQLRT